MHLIYSQSLEKKFFLLHLIFSYTFLNDAFLNDAHNTENRCLLGSNTEKICEHY